jgi:hypothetical protein
MKIINALFCAAMLLACSWASASFISMATDFSVSETADGLVLVVSTENRGDERAYGVQLEVQTGDQQFASSVVPQLAVNEKLEEEYTVDDAFSLPGHYPIIIKTHYKDANGYPFSALSVAFYDYKQPVVSKILIRAEGVSIPSNGKGKVGFVIRNTDSVVRNLDLVLYLPDELVAVSERQSIQLEPGSEERLQFLVENFSALENSSYAIALVAQYEDDARHYSNAGPAVVKITGPSEMSALWIWAVGGTVAIFVIVLLIVFRRQKKSPS